MDANVTKNLLGLLSSTTEPVLLNFAALARLTFSNLNLFRSFSILRENFVN